MPARAQQVAIAEAEFHAWNPGIVSCLPASVRPFATVFQPDNVALSYREIEDLSDLSGLPATQLAPFRPERLVVHEVLIRVMADLSVPLGAVYADLGVNFRRIVATILRDGADPHLPEISACLRSIRAQADATLDREISLLLDEPARETNPAPSRSGRSLFGFLPTRRRAAPAAPKDWPACALRRLDDLRGHESTASDSLESTVRDALRTVVASLVARQGMLIRDRALIRSLAGILVSNAYGSLKIGELIEPWFDAIVAREGYRRVAPQSRPVVMNVKGASASGKSTIRPYQRALVGRIRADWSDFAVISPDVWRKFLLDYDSLGSARRYAGPLTGHEVEIVDAKLDRYMARKAAEGRISHLLIDRFRFDSFSVDARADGSGLLLTRFGHRIYLQFMVTPPEATVERAWKRGEEFGRYKAVEDLLAHNVEAYAGMPRLFFLWALRQDKAVFFEFLDNSVPKGATPRTIAFGTNGVMNILDAGSLIDIERYRKINIHARSSAEVYAGVDPSPERNAGFLRECLSRLSTVRFAEQETGQVFARFEGGRLSGLDRAVLARAGRNRGSNAALQAVGLLACAGGAVDIDETLAASEVPTLGAWGQGAEDAQ